MKFLIHSNGPHVSTGYGVQTRYLVERLHDAGHDVAVSCTYGVQGAVMPWGSRKIKLYPTGYETNSNDIIHNHALHHFGGDPAGGWIIPLLDLWCLVNPRLADFNVAGWCPVDHFPVPQDVLRFFKRNPDAVPIAMSRYGERQLAEAGLNPVYIPLAVDTKVYKPSRSVTIDGHELTGRQLLSMGDGPHDPIPDSAFVVGMVAMNKGWARDRKGFNEALRAFAQFWKAHPDAVLYMHCDWPGGAEGINLKELAIHAGVPDHAIRWVDQYAYRMGFSPEMMAAAYSAMDVLLAPSHGEGFCVPLIEAQACGTPVIATDFSSQSELIGPGSWTVLGQPEWDPPQHASYICPYIEHIVERLEECYRADLAEIMPQAVEFAQQYDADRVFNEYWLPFLAELEQEPEVLKLERKPMPDTDAVAVIVPLMRPENLDRLISSFNATNDGSAELVVVQDDDLTVRGGAGKNVVLHHAHATTYAEKVNAGFAETSQPWVLLVGDDVEFKPGWLEAARKLSGDFDVIGTNDTDGAPRNPDVAAGRHSDHSFFRRSYVEEYGASLDGPGVLASEAFQHWFVDKEQIELAKARGVFSPCLDSVVVHHHPGYEGKFRDDIYMKAIEHSEQDQKTFQGRLPLIAMQRTGRGKR